MIGIESDDFVFAPLRVAAKAMAVRDEGEVEICCDSFHLRPTNQNGPQYITMVEQMRAAISRANGESL